MNLFIDRHQNLLKTLLKHEVDFIIIGGYSVIFHGYKRTTGDVDIWLKPSNENKIKVINALKTFEIEEDDLAHIMAMDFEKFRVFHIWEPPERVDFLTKISLVEYEDADKIKIISEVDDLKIPFLHLKHLVLSKIALNRPKDKADIDELQKIQKLKNKNTSKE